MALLITEQSTQVELWENKQKEPYIVGIFATHGIKNANGRVYEKKLLERETTKFMSEKIENKVGWGELGHPEQSDVNLGNVAIITEQLEWRGNDLYGKARVLETDAGRTVQALMKAGNIGISSRGLGTVNENGKVNEDFSLICWDVVADASNPGSRFMNGILEGKTFELPSERMTVEEAEEEYVKHQISVINQMMKKI
jgi:hypothetical protein